MIKNKSIPSNCSIYSNKINRESDMFNKHNNCNCPNIEIKINELQPDNNDNGGSLSYENGSLLQDINIIPRCNKTMRDKVNDYENYIKNNCCSGDIRIRFIGFIFDKINYIVDLDNKYVLYRPINSKVDYRELNTKINVCLSPNTVAYTIGFNLNKDYSVQIEIYPNTIDRFNVVATNNKTFSKIILENDELSYNFFDWKLMIDKDKNLITNISYSEILKLSLEEISMIFSDTIKSTLIYNLLADVKNNLTYSDIVKNFLSLGMNYYNEIINNKDNNDCDNKPDDDNINKDDNFCNCNNGNNCCCRPNIPELPSVPDDILVNNKEINTWMKNYPKDISLYKINRKDLIGKYILSGKVDEELNEIISITYPNEDNIEKLYIEIFDDFSFSIYSDYSDEKSKNEIKISYVLNEEGICKHINLLLKDESNNDINHLIFNPETYEIYDYTNNRIFSCEKNEINIFKGLLTVNNNICGKEFNLIDNERLNYQKDENNEIIHPIFTKTIEIDDEKYNHFVNCDKNADLEFILNVSGTLTDIKDIHMGIEIEGDEENGVSTLLYNKIKENIYIVRIPKLVYKDAIINNKKIKITSIIHYNELDCIKRFTVNILSNVTHTKGLL